MYILTYNNIGFHAKGDVRRVSPAHPGLGDHLPHTKGGEGSPRYQVSESCHRHHLKLDGFTGKLECCRLYEEGGWVILRKIL